MKRLILAAALLLVPVGANASLLGQTITCSNSAPEGFNPTQECQTATAVVGAGIEFDLENAFLQTLTVDVGESSVLIEAESFSQAFQTLTLGDLIWAGHPLAEITGIANLMLSGLSGGAPVFGTTAHSVSITFADNTEFEAGGFISFDLVTTHETDVPEPGLVALFGLSVLGLGLANRTRRPKA